MRLLVSSVPPGASYESGHQDEQQQHVRGHFCPVDLARQRCPLGLKGFVSLALQLACWISSRAMRALVHAWAYM